MSKVIYLDFNATTPCDPAVTKSMLPFFEMHFGNCSSGHSIGRAAALGLQEGRARVAQLLHCQASEICFTSGGTESNNMAICGVAFAQARQVKPRRHIITSEIEHPAVSEVCDFLEQHHGFSVTRVKVNQNGYVDVDAIEKVISEETALISIMLANNEIGTIQPIAEIARLAKKFGVPVHTDAAQAIGKIPVDVNELQVDLLTVAGHKLYAPKGIGALFIRDGTVLQKWQHGANHEQNRRAGTENVPYIVGLGTAAKLANEQFLSEAFIDDLIRRRELLLALLTELLGDNVVKRNGGKKIDHKLDLKSILPNTLNVSLNGIDAAQLLKDVESHVAASAGAACHAGVVKMSKVLKAIQLNDALALGTLRLSLGRHTTDDEIRRAALAIAECAQTQLKVQ